jgi:hypothetical protein
MGSNNEGRQIDQFACPQPRSLNGKAGAALPTLSSIQVQLKTQSNFNFFWRGMIAPSEARVVWMIFE